MFISIMSCTNNREPVNIKLEFHQRKYVGLKILQAIDPNFYRAAGSFGSIHGPVVFLKGKEFSPKKPYIIKERVQVF